MKFMPYPIITITLWLLASAIQAQPVIEDEGIGIDREELLQIVAGWRPEMQKAAANDLGDRLELLNMVLANKKMAQQADKLSETDPETYWKYVFWLQKQQRKFVFDRYTQQLEVPDMSALAEERYITQKDKYAKMPEQRTSSHILFSCPPGCDRTIYRPKAEEVLEQLRGGADFEEMVALHSQDPGTKAKKGKLDRWVTLGGKGVVPHYSGALFEIEDVGGYSGVVDTQFGLHIIRLDGVRESHYRPFEEVRDSIVQELEAEYVELASKEFQAQFRVTDDVRIDGPAMEEIFGPYKTTTD